jgi:hypothetical protein
MEVEQQGSKMERRAEVNPEEGDVMPDGGGAGSAVVAVEDTAELQIDVRMDVAVFLCQACLLPLKPPIFKVSSRLNRSTVGAKIRIPFAR